MLPRSRRGRSYFTHPKSRFSWTRVGGSRHRLVSIGDGWTRLASVGDGLGRRWARSAMGSVGDRLGRRLARSAIGSDGEAMWHHGICCINWMNSLSHGNVTTRLQSTGLLSFLRRRHSATEVHPDSLLSNYILAGTHLRTVFSSRSGQDVIRCIWIQDRPWSTSPSRRRFDSAAIQSTEQLSCGIRYNLDTISYPSDVHRDMPTQITETNS